MHVASPVVVKSPASEQLLLALLPPASSVSPRLVDSPLLSTRVLLAASRSWSATITLLRSCTPSLERYTVGVRKTALSCVAAARPIE